LAKAGIGHEALDNGFRACADPQALQPISDRLGPMAVRWFFWRWIRYLPSAFTDSDRRHGYVYELAFRQFEVSDTCIGRRVNGPNWHPGGRGWAANRRLCEAQGADTTPARDVDTFKAVTCPSRGDGDRGLRPPFVGFDNPTLTWLVAILLDQPYSPRQATYDLRRLRRKGISRGSLTRQLPAHPLGRRVAVLFTKTHGRTLNPDSSGSILHYQLPLPEKPPRHCLASTRSCPRRLREQPDCRRLKLDLTIHFVRSKSN